MTILIENNAAGMIRSKKNISSFEYDKKKHRFQKFPYYPDDSGATEEGLHGTPTPTTEVLIQRPKSSNLGRLVFISVLRVLPLLSLRNFHFETARRPAVYTARQMIYVFSRTPGKRLSREKLYSRETENHTENTTAAAVASAALFILYSPGLRCKALPRITVRVRSRSVIMPVRAVGQSHVRA